MSKLAQLRGSASNASVFAAEVDSTVSSIFARLQGQRSGYTKNSLPQKAKFVPSRFRCKPNETKRIVVIDEKFTFGVTEHSLQGPDGKWTTERCIAAWDSCPLCGKDNVNTADAVLLTVLDLTPWETKDGQTVEYSKRVLAVKKGDLAAFTGLMGVHGSLRGLVLDMTRGDSPKETAIGKPTFVQKLTDDDLVEMFGHPAKMSEKGTVIVPENDSVQPWNYDKYFTVPSRMDLARKYNIGPRPGSVEEEVNEPAINLLDLAEELPDIE